jgi:CRISPR-associated protein Cas6
MLGILVLRLRVKVGGHYSIFPGKLLHGTFFHYLSTCAPTLGDDLHTRKIKPFTIGFFRRTGKPLPVIPRAQDLNEPHYAVGEVVLLRLTALDDAALEAFLRIPPETELVVGKLTFTVEEILADGREDTGITAAEELMAAVFSMEEVMHLRFSFLSPTLFHADGYDCAVPRPELIFASLADKWTWQGLPVAMDKSYVRTIAAKLIPLEWRGAGIRIRQSERKTVPGFMGNFSFSMECLSEEEREVIRLLAQFAPFCGTGRLTAQGMGETHMFFTTGRG